MSFDPNDGGTLYHYTTAEGLQGIIKTKSIWASDYRFLNDATEFDYGLSIFDKIFEGFAMRLPSEVVEVIKRTKERAEKESPKNTVLEWWPQFLKSIAACKNEHFKEEQEWRLVKFTDEWPEGIYTRPIRSGLVPYVSVKLNAKEINNPPLHPKNVGIERIIVAPGLADHQKKAVNALIASQHMRFIIQKSDIPYIPNV